MPASSVYVLRADCRRRHYTGATRDIEHRLRQHNGELAGGAKATRGRSWHVHFLVTGFDQWGAALRFEHQLKATVRKRRARSHVHERHAWAVYTVAGSQEWYGTGITVQQLAW